MKPNLLHICVVIVVLCFISIAYSQHQRAAAEKAIAESIRLLAANEAWRTKNTLGREGHAAANRFDGAYALDWSLESSFLFAIGSRYANPKTAKEVYAKWDEESKEMTKKQAADREKVEACLKNKNLSPTATEEEKETAEAVCYMREIMGVAP